ncbi:hypothetical protein GW915_09135 [bacterium]|nr:hypothetical protein [bacterium]
MGSFFDGIKSFFKALSLIFRNQEVFQWFKKTSIVAFIVALIVMAILALSGATVISWLGAHWVADLGAVLWVLFILYFSGTLCITVMSAVFGLWGNEHRLMSALLKEPGLVLSKAKLSDMRSEIFGATWSLLAAFISLPFIFFVPLMPIGVLIMAIAFGREAVCAARRILHQCQRTTAVDEKMPTFSFYIGLGFCPVLLTLVPLVGWVMWPVLLLSALIGVMKLQAPTRPLLKTE